MPGLCGTAVTRQPRSGGRIVDMVAASGDDFHTMVILSGIERGDAVEGFCRILCQDVAVKHHIF